MWSQPLGTRSSGPSKPRCPRDSRWDARPGTYGRRSGAGAGALTPHLRRVPARDIGHKNPVPGCGGDRAGRPRGRGCTRKTADSRERSCPSRPSLCSFRFFYFLLFSEPQRTRAWVGWSHSEGPGTGRTIFPAAGDAWHAGIRSLSDGWSASPPPRHPPPPTPMSDVFAAWDRPSQTQSVFFPCCLN